MTTVPLWKPPPGDLERAVALTVAEAVAVGRLDADRHAVLIAALRAQAADIDGRLQRGESVAFSIRTLLEVLDAAGLLPPKVTDDDDDDDAADLDRIAAVAARLHPTATGR